MSDLEERLRDAIGASLADAEPMFDVMAAVRLRHRWRLIRATVASAVLVAAAVLAAALLATPRIEHGGVPVTPVPCRPGWSVASGAVPAGDHADSLVAIAGSASDDLWAVGSRGPNQEQEFPLLEHWDGRRWAYSAGASLGGRQALLTSVAALGSRNVWAVGNFLSTGPSREGPLVEHWDGRAWSLLPTDAFRRLQASLPLSLTSVAVLAPDDVWVLSHSSYGSSIYVYLHWNGTSWSLFPGPDISPRFGTAAMQAIGTDHLGPPWAVGGWMRGIGEAGVPGGGIVERWNGRRWEVDRRSAWREPLTMVAPVASNDVWAVAGGYLTTAGTYGVIPIRVLHWNGSTWRVELPLGGTGSVDPTGLVAVSAHDAYVIGQDATTQRPFIDHWDGRRWRSVPTGPAGRMQRPGSTENRSPSLTVTSDGSIAALATAGPTDRTNFLWLRCPR